MAFTRPKAAQIDFDATNISDSIIRINSSETGANTNDIGIVFERGSHTNAAIVWDESADAFRMISTTHSGDGSTTDINISAHHNLHVGTLVYGSLNDGTTTLTATVAELNYVDGVTSNIQTQIDNISSSFTLAADSGSSDTFTTGQTLTIAGGTGIDTTVSDNQISVAIDSTVATLTGTQTLTNKTLTSPTVNTPTITTPTITGNATFDTNTLFVDATNNRIGIGTTSPAYQVEIENTGANALLVLDRTDGAACFIEGQATRSAFGSVGATPLALAYNSLAVVTIGASGAITVNPDGGSPFTLPTADGTANQFLQTNGSGTVSFASATVSDISDLTATAAELNILDGVTSTATELNLLDGVTGTLVTEAGTQTLSNKTLTAPKIASGGYIADENGNEQIVFTTTASAVNYFTVTNTATGANQINLLGAAGGDTNIGIGLSTKGTGNVQIGSGLSAGANPSRKLQVLTDSASKAAIGVQASGTTATEKALIDFFAVNGTQLTSIGQGAATSELFRLDSVSGYIFATGSGSHAGGTERVRIDSSGNLKFNDLGSQQIDWGGSNAYITGQHTNAFLKLLATGSIQFHNASGEKVRIDSSGNVGIGTSSVATNLHVYENTNNGAINNIALLDAGNQNPSVAGSGVAMDFRSNSGTSYFGAVGGYSDGTNYVAGLWGGAAASGAPDLAVTSSGNVGIGTTSLANKLDVSGDIGLLAQGEVRFYDTDSSNYVALRASGTVTSNLTFSLPTAYGDNGQVLTTDGAGGTSWTTASGGGGGSSGFVNSTTTTVPAAASNYDLAEGPAQDGDETPFEAGAVDAFGVNLGTIYDCMEPTGSINTVDYGDSEAYVGA